MYVITLHQPWASLIALGSKAVIKRADEVILEKLCIGVEVSTMPRKRTCTRGYQP